MFRVANANGSYYGITAAQQKHEQSFTSEPGRGGGPIVHVGIISVLLEIHFNASRVRGSLARSRSEEIQFQNHKLTHSGGPVFVYRGTAGAGSGDHARLYL